MNEQYDEYPFFEDDDYKVPSPVLPINITDASMEQERLHLIKVKREELKRLFNIDLND